MRIRLPITGDHAEVSVNITPETINALDQLAIAARRSVGIATFASCSESVSEANATCPNCRLKGTVGVSTDAIIHKTVLCVTCANDISVWESCE